MQLQSTFGAFLVALTMVHGAPLLVERQLARTGNMTANANQSGPGSGFRAGGGRFKPGMMQGANNDDASDVNASGDDAADVSAGGDNAADVNAGGEEAADVSAGEDGAANVNAGDNGSDENESVKRADGIKTGSSSSSGASADPKKSNTATPQANVPAGVISISRRDHPAQPAADTGSPADENEPAKRADGKKTPTSTPSGETGKKPSSPKTPTANVPISGVVDARGSATDPLAKIPIGARSLFVRDHPTQPGADTGSPEGSNVGSPGKPPGGQPNGGSTTTGPSRTSGDDAAPGGSRNGSPQPPAGDATPESDTASSESAPVQVRQAKKPTSVPSGQQAKQQNPSPQTSSDNSDESSSESATNVQKTAASGAKKAAARAAVKARAQSGNPTKSGSPGGAKSPAGSSTSNSSPKGQSAGQSPGQA